MGLEWLNNRSWLDISREERLFCAHLYFDIKGKEKKFVKWLSNELKSLKCNPDADWEVGFEVCFYRDYLFEKRYKIREYNKKLSDENNKKYSEKRTFDLCLFSDEQIIIMEAKAQQGFEVKQMKSFKDDKMDVSNILKGNGNTVGVNLIGICSSVYCNNLKQYGNQNILNPFDGVITWKDISSAKMFQRNENIYKKADELYKK